MMPKNSILRYEVSRSKSERVSKVDSASKLHNKLLCILSYGNFDDDDDNNNNNNNNDNENSLRRVR